MADFNSGDAAWDETLELSNRVNIISQSNNVPQGSVSQRLNEAQVQGQD